MIFFLPYKVDVQSTCIPVMNQLLVALCILCFGAVGPSLMLSMVLDGWNIGGLFGHVFVHAGVAHLLWNMVYLWIFGSAICGRVGNRLYVPVFLILTLAVAVGHNLLSGGPAVGASGLVNGLIGMFVVWFPAEYMTCVLLFGFTPRVFEIKAYWMIGLWVLEDIFGLMSGESGVGYCAHLSGFVAGFLLGTAMLKLGLVDLDDQVTLFDLKGLS